MKIPKTKHLILVTLSLFVLVLDQASKIAVLQNFRLGETLAIVSGYFNLTYIRNTGAAFGLLAHAPPDFRVPFFIIVPFIAIVAIGFVFRKVPAGDVKLSCALALVSGGAVGNLIDRIRLGYVVDFLDFHWRYEIHFPAFNVADSAICSGVAVLMLDLLAKRGEDPKEETQINAPASF